ncbi:MAG: prepilin-type N-terminal cleavage/methylation domain-containing protein [Acidobacteriota bacterium]|nr:prepilin-type N-terminal cleavage/methylation domain-containing protein [Acidobacteriota bacterium]
MKRRRASEVRVEKAERRPAQAGFSLLELLIALLVMLFVMAAASQLLVSSFRIRSRADKRGEALADARRALDAMTHEIASAGYKLPSGLGLPSNGIVSADSSSTSIRFVTNTGSTNTAAVSEANEDVMYRLTTDASGNSFITRYDMNSGPASSVIGNRIDNLTIRYYDQIVRYTLNTNTCDINTGGTAESTNRSNSTYVVISVCVTLPQVGSPGTDGYQAASTVQMTSDVFLRNTTLTTY